MIPNKGNGFFIENFKKMTTQQFENQLSNVKSLNDLCILRTEVRASKFVSMMKKKVQELAENEGYQPFTCSLSALKNITVYTDCNNLANIVIPEKNRVFSDYRGKSVSVYINHKEGTKTQTVYGFVK